MVLFSPGTNFLHNINLQLESLLRLIKLRIFSLQTVQAQQLYSHSETVKTHEDGFNFSDNYSENNGVEDMPNLIINKQDFLYQGVPHSQS